MSRLNIEKKLLPAKKAWKSFTSTIQKKLHKLKKSKAINKTTKRLNTTLSTVLRRKNKTVLNRRPSSALRIHHRKNHNLRPIYKPVYIDELFMQPTVLQVMSRAGNKAKEGATMDRGSLNMSKMETKFLSQPSFCESSKGISKMAVQTINNDVLGCPSSPIPPQLRGVDERAEEFITKFKEEMRLQRQRSFGEFQEMLARSA